MAFAWNPTDPESPFPISGPIKPADVLYYFNEPLTFVANEALPLLCHKIDEDASYSQFVVVPTSDEVVTRLRQGALSVRAALEQPWCWIIETDGHYNVERSWRMTVDKIPEDFMPQRGLGLYPEHGILEEAASDRAFMSISFFGLFMRHGTQSFAGLKTILDDAYDSLMKIFAAAIYAIAPSGISGSALRRSLFIPLYQPKFGSLILSIERPELDLELIKKITGDDFDYTLAERSFDAARHTFFESAGKVVLAASKGKLSSDFAGDHLDAIGAVSQILPTDHSNFDRLEISIADSPLNERRIINITSNTGQAIRNAYELAVVSQDTFSGTVVEVSKRSGTFILSTATQREITCMPPSYAFTLQQEIKNLRNGKTVKIRGKYIRRSRRDKIILDWIKIGNRRRIHADER